MPEPEYIVEIRGNRSLTIWICQPHSAVTEHSVPKDGSVLLRDATTGAIVGKRVSFDLIATWTDDQLADTFADAFGWGGAGPLRALRNALNRLLDSLTATFPQQQQ